MKQFAWLFVVGFAYLVVGSASASDEFGDLAKLVCKTTNSAKNHLTTLASVTGVINHLKSLPSGHKLEECRDKYLESLEQLAHVVEAASGDVCGPEKLALLEAYHRRYISKIGKHERERKHKSKAPKLAKLFFMQYASKISSICNQAVLEAAIDNKLTISDERMARVEGMKHFTDSLGMTDYSKGYNGIYLFWNMVDSLELNKKDKFAKYLVDGEENRLNIQLRNAQDLAEIQALCRSQLKPIYSNTLLPVLRLVDMGYYPDSDSLIKSEGALKNLLYATQICESLLPVGVYLNENLNTDQVIALSKDDASKMSPIKLQESNEASPAQPLEISPRSLSVSELNFADNEFNKVKASVNYRGQVVLRMLKNMSKQLKKLKSLVKGFKLFEKDSNKLEPIDEDHLEKMAEQSLQIYDNPETGMVRKKREPVFIACLTIIVIILFILGVIYMVKSHYYHKEMARQIG